MSIAKILETSWYENIFDHQILTAQEFNEVSRYFYELMNQF
jgi:hypothetical protein